MKNNDTNMKKNNINNNDLKLLLESIITYTNTDLLKNKIKKENYKKSGIYRWNNLINGKSYIGSSISLTGRFNIYYSTSPMKNKLSKGSSAIYQAIIKYRYANFSLDILEYCDTSLLIKREQYYIDLLKPEYNILKVAGNRLGSKHSEATKIKIGIKHKGVNHHFFGKMHTLETRIKISEGVKTTLASKDKIYKKVISLETRLKLSLRSHGVPIKIFDISNILVKEFPTMTSAAKHFNVSSNTICRYLNKDKQYNGFMFKS